MPARGNLPDSALVPAARVPYRDMVERLVDRTNSRAPTRPTSLNAPIPCLVAHGQDSGDIMAMNPRREGQRRGVWIQVIVDPCSTERCRCPDVTLNEQMRAAAGLLDHAAPATSAVGSQ